MSKRIEQVQRLLQKELGMHILRTFELPHGTLVTITRVVAGPDLKHATAYVIIHPHSQEESVLGALIQKRKELSALIAEGLTMKFSPKLSFKIDTIEKNAAHIESILDSLSP